MEPIESKIKLTNEQKEGLANVQKLAKEMGVATTIRIIQIMPADAGWVARYYIDKIYMDTDKNPINRGPVPYLTTHPIVMWALVEKKWENGDIFETVEGLISQEGYITSAENVSNFFDYFNPGSGYHEYRDLSQLEIEKIKFMSEGTD